MLEGTSPVATGFVNSVSGAKAAKESSAAFSLRDVPGVSSSPPAEVQNALDRAARVAAELRSRRLDVHFDVGNSGRVQVKVVDAGGNVLREIPVARALDLLSGDGPTTIFEELERA